MSINFNKWNIRGLYLKILFSITLENDFGLPKIVPQKIAPELVVFHA